MITKDEALTANEFHYTGKQQCTATTGTRGGVKLSYVKARRNGKTQTWKTRPDEFRVPVKHGLYEYGEITLSDAENWHTAENCPLREQGHYV